MKQQSKRLLQNPVDFLNRLLDAAQLQIAKLKNEAECLDGSTKVNVEKSGTKTHKNQKGVPGGKNRLNGRETVR